MQSLHSIFVWVHILTGFTGLVAFWIPVLTRKGGKYHKLFGRIFKYCAYLVLLAAVIALLLRSPEMLATDFDDPAQVLMLSFYVFLSYLILVVYIGMRHGFAVLAHKNDITELNTPLNNAFVWISIAASIALLTYTIIVSPVNQILLYVLSPLGIINGLDIRTAITNKHHLKKTWLYEHLNALLGTGIAFHTAFAVFGAGQLFDFNLNGFLQVLPWITPTLLGVPAIMIWTRMYKQRFGDLKNSSLAINES